MMGSRMMVSGSRDLARITTLLEGCLGSLQDARLKIRKSALFVLTLGIALASPVAFAQAQTGFPTRPVRMIVPFPPGQATDIVARMLGEELTKIWGQQVVIENRAGGATVPGMMAARNAPADGYTMALATSSSLAVNPSLYAKLPYVPGDFAMVNGVFIQPWLIVANLAAPFGTLKDMVALAKKEPGKLSWGHGAPALQLAGEHFAHRAAIGTVAVPYKGSGPAITDLLGGQIPLLVDTMASALPHVKAGKIKALAVMSAKRAPQLPDVPTVDELGYPGFEGSGWGGLVVPKATPAEIVEKIGSDVRRVLNDPAIQRRLIEIGSVADSRGPQEWTRFVNAEIVKWAEIAQRANIKAE